jgi:hypothetical protein
MAEGEHHRLAMARRCRRNNRDAVEINEATRRAMSGAHNKKPATLGGLIL